MTTASTPEGELALLGSILCALAVSASEQLHEEGSLSTSGTGDQVFDMADSAATIAANAYIPGMGTAVHTLVSTAKDMIDSATGHDPHAAEHAAEARKAAAGKKIAADMKAAALEMERAEAARAKRVAAEKKEAAKIAAAAEAERKKDEARLRKAAQLTEHKAKVMRYAAGGVLVVTAAVAGTAVFVFRKKGAR